jgi:hypothetical protein
MNKKTSRIILKATLFLLAIHKTCFASEIESQGETSLHQTTNHIPFSSIPPHSTELTPHTNQSTKPAIHEINKQLHDNYSLIHPDIQLSPETYAEISHISQQYESPPTDIFYNHTKNQVRLLWKTDKIFSILRPKKKTFNLAATNTDSTTVSGDITLRDSTTLSTNDEAPNNSNVQSDSELINAPVEWINNELLKHYAPINPHIKLSPTTYNEIAHITMRYESYPEDILYNHQKNQARLIWRKRTCCSIFGPMKRTYNLAKIITDKPTKKQKKVHTQTHRQAIAHITSNNATLSVQQRTATQSAHHPLTPANYLRRTTNVQSIPTHNPTSAQQKQLVRRYVLTQEAAISIFNEWFCSVCPMYSGVYLEPTDYNKLITDLRKNGRATLNGYQNTMLLIATWPNQQQRSYQLRG